MNSPAKRLLNLLVIASLALLAAACGGGGSDHQPPPPPPPSAKFTNASLSGQYAFSMKGTELCGGGGSFFTRAGSFFADGNGHITNGLEDINVCSGVDTLQFTGGRYSIGADGRGALELTNNTGTTTYSIVLSTTSAGSITQTDVDSTASGSFQRQNTAAFSNAAIAGGYVFDFNGLDVTDVGNSASYIGRFDADGAGSVNNGLFDSNIGGTLSGQQLFPSGAFYQLDTNGDGATFGRGTANIAGLSFAFYVVDATRVKFIGTDFPSAFIGDAFAQQNVAFTPSSVAGSFAFLIAGWSPNGPIATAGRFTADGAGTLSTVVLDENSAGSITLLPSGTVTGTFTVDENQFGGGTMTWTDTTAGTFSFIFYLISPTQAVFQETDSTIASNGTFLGQTTTPISGASVAGDYTVGWTGINSDNGDFTSTRSGEEDFLGQFTLGSSGSVSGKIDLNEFPTGQQFFDVPLGGSLTLAGDGTQANTFDANVPTSVTSTLNFTAYVVDQNTTFVVETSPVGGGNAVRVLAGVLTRQP